jgi:capsular exopolysaccharide synthesis family protein
MSLIQKALPSIPAAETGDVKGKADVPAAPQAAVHLVPAGDRGLQHSDAGAPVAFCRVVPAKPSTTTAREIQRLISALDESDPVLDQLRSLAATLHQARTYRELKVLVVTSSVGGEGKTLIAANLALTLSQSYGRQVLVIDADLRRPGQQSLFGVAADDGLRSALAALTAGEAVPIQEVAPGMALIPAGKALRDPTSILASTAMQRLVTSAASAFDWVIIDTPPVGMLPDASLLSSLSDAVLLVVEAGRVRYDLVQRTVESIGADRIFGVVLNKIAERELVAAYGEQYYAPYR